MHVISPFENSVVLCNVSQGFFKSFGRPSKDLVYAGLISNRKTKYIHLLEDTVLATLLRVSTVVRASEPWILVLAFVREVLLELKSVGFKSLSRLLCRGCYERSVGENKRKLTQ